MVLKLTLNITTELKSFYYGEIRETWSSLTELEDKGIELQRQIYDLQNQNCEYELKFSRLSSSAESRVLDTEASAKTGGPLPWKDFIKNYQININKEQAQ